MSLNTVSINVKGDDANCANEFILTCYKRLGIVFIDYWLLILL